tara:strand:+ start:588 stop:788 length:201 start_codon:yes stop_codon:yes gene_type:complete
MTNKDIENFTSKLVSLKNKSSINDITIRTYEKHIAYFENAEGLIINTLDNEELTDKEKLKIIKDIF